MIVLPSSSLTVAGHPDWTGQPPPIPLTSPKVQREGNNAVDMSSFGIIDRLFIDFTAQVDGSVFNNFNFDTVSAVPLPTTLPLYGAGLVLLGFIGWRRHRR